MTRRDQQQRIGKTAQHFGVRLQHDELLAFVRARRDPDRTVRTGGAAELAAPLDDFRRHVHVELQIADDASRSVGAPSACRRSPSDADCAAMKLAQRIARRASGWIGQ